MCGRYFIDLDMDDGTLAQIISDLNRRGAGESLKTSGEVFPTDLVPVLARSRAGNEKPFAMRWGYTLSNGRRVINARSETARERAMFAEGMQARRCLIPASGYYEWRRQEKARDKFAVRTDGGGTMYMAGLYRYEGGAPVFTILTRAPAPSVAFIHDRMPVILPPDAAREWLNPMCSAQDVLQKAALSVSAGAV